MPYDQTRNFTGWDGLEAKLFFSPELRCIRPCFVDGTGGSSVATGLYSGEPTRATGDCTCTGRAGSNAQFSGPGVPWTCAVSTAKVVAGGVYGQGQGLNLVK